MDGGSSPPISTKRSEGILRPFCVMGELKSNTGGELFAPPEPLNLTHVLAELLRDTKAAKTDAQGLRGEGLAKPEKVISDG